MPLNSFLKRVVFSTLVISSYAFSFSLVDSLLEQKDLKQLNNYIQKAILIENDSQLPDNPKENQLLIVDNEYDVKILYEYYEGEWNEKTGPQIAQLLNGGNKTSFHHLFNFKLEKEDFNAYTSDEKLIHIEILKSSYQQDHLNQTIQGFMKQKNLKADDIITMQIQNISQKSCDIIIGYKY